MMYSNHAASTNFSYNENAYPLDMEIKQYGSKVLPLGLGFLLLFGANSTEFFSMQNEKETILTESQLRQELAYRESINENLVLSSSQQLAEIKQNMGLNILEMAAILHVSRPTVYDWFASKKTIRKNNQARIDILYDVCRKWKIKGLHRMGSFLHKKIGESNLSLFDLLKSEILNQKEINKHLDIITQIILQKSHKDKAYDDMLRKHSFDPVSKENMEDRLNDIHFLD